MRRPGWDAADARSRVPSHRLPAAAAERNKLKIMSGKRDGSRAGGDEAAKLNSYLLFVPQPAERGDLGMKCVETSK